MNNVNDKIDNLKEEQTSITMSIVKMNDKTTESHGKIRRQRHYLQLRSDQLRNDKCFGPHDILHHLRNDADFAFLKRILENRLNM